MAVMIDKSKKMQFNEQQEEACNHVNGPCYVSAAPGAGKTAVLVERTVRLIKSGVPASKILTVTFTNKAGSEIKERIVRALGDEAEQLYVSTFHSLCANILRKFSTSKLSIFDTDESEQFAAQIARHQGLNLKTDEIKQIVWKLNDLRENLVSEEDIPGEFYQKFEGKIAKTYLEKMRQIDAVDFSGLLYDTVKLLRDNKSVLNTLHNRFEYLAVDEAQDSNAVQFELTNLLGEKSKNIFLIADLDQSIYRFRGSKPELVFDFIKKHNARTLRLPMNYRSTGHIVSTASKLIQHNPNRPKEWTFITDNPPGDPVQGFSLPTPEIEAKFIATKIKQQIHDGEKPESIAVIYRLNSMARVVEMALLGEGIQYQTLGSFSFYDRKEIKAALGILRFVVNPRDSMALSKFINCPRRHIGEVTLGKIELYAEEHNVDLIEALDKSGEYLDAEGVVKGCVEIAKAFKRDDIKQEGQSIAYVLSELLKELRYEEYLKTDKSTVETFQDRTDNLIEFINAAALYSEERSGNIAAFLNSIALMTSNDQKNADGKVQLLTGHAAKGREWNTVYAPGLTDDVLPHWRAVKEPEKGGIEGERNLAYVIFSRAKKKLIPTYPFKKMLNYTKGQGVSFKHTIPSRFLAEAGISTQKIGT